MSEPSKRTAEPEIIPPGAPLHRPTGVRMGDDIRGSRYVYTARMGPVGFALTTLAIGAIGVLAFLFVLGAAFIGLLAIGALVAVGFIAGLLRKPNQPLR